MIDFETEPPGDGLRERNKRDKRARILAAARALFSENGFDATTTREIAERAGVGVGTLFSYARDKRELMYLVFREELEGTRAKAFENVPQEASLVDQLMHVFGHFFDAYDRDRALALDFLRQRFHVFLDAEQAGEEMTGVTLSFFDGLGSLIHDARRRDRLRTDFPVTIAAMNFFAIYLLVVDSWLGSPWQLPRDEFERMLREALTLQVDGLRTRPRLRTVRGGPS